MTKHESDLRRDLIHVCRLMYENRFVAATDGNVSAKLTDDRLLFTPSGVSKALVTEEQLIVTDMAGRKVRGTQEPSSEIRMHLAVYEERDDVRAVVHAHPPIATAFTVAGVSLAPCVLPEVVFHLGTIPTSAYATPASPQGPGVVRDLIRKCDAILLDRHGTLTVGEDVFKAYFKLEKVENYAQVMLIARQLGNVRTLPTDEVERLMQTRRQLGITGRVTMCMGCDVSGMPGETGRIRRTRKPRGK
ncbi:MAG TPA: class II aldolase/adducin family protein [Planctomycetota bacterium]|nr:class II aldolase/adducin family protein [Planctomycetota bacterium]